MSEQKGRCYNEMKVSRDFPTDHFVMADAIDRLAADVAAVKAKVDAVSPDDVRHFVDSEKAWVAHVTEQRDEAIRQLDEARAAIEKLKESRDAANRLYGVEQAKVERLKAELDDREQTDGNSPKTSDSSPAAPQPAAPPAGWLTDEERELLALVVTAILARAGSPPEQTAAGWLTEEERRVLQNHAESLREQRFALERGGQTLGYSANPGSLKREADIIDRLLARAGSPPVVEVPAMGLAAYGFDCPFSSGEYRAGYREACLAHRDAMDKAGVKWNEVGRG